VPRALQPFNSL